MLDTRNGDALASAERVFEFLDEEEEVPDTTSPEHVTAPQGRVSFEYVRFGYAPDSILMQDVSLT